MMLRSRWFVVLASLTSLVAVAALPAKPPPPFKQGPTVEGIAEYALPNGLKVVLLPDPSKDTVTVNITYFVGSRHEDYGETGMAHLLEHLVFKGTKKTPNVPQALVEHGARPNGTTSNDRTNYFETMPASDKNLEWALHFEADRMVNSFIAKKDLDSEMTVVRNELEMGENNPRRVLEERVLSSAYLWHNYGKSTIGSRSDLENVPIERLQAFYRRYYQPDNAMLVVAGNFEPSKALAYTAKAFAAIPKPKRALASTYTAEPVQDGERSVTVRRVGGAPLLLTAYHAPPGSHEDFAALDVLTAVLGDSPGGRLHKALVETRKAANVRATAEQLREPGVLTFSVETRREDPLAPAQEALLSTVEKLAAAPVTQEEVERARTSLLQNIELTLNHSERVALQLSEWAAMGDWRLLFLYRDRLKAVTAADVQRVAQTYLKPSNRTLGTYVPTDAPDRSDIPKAPVVAELLRDYRGGQAVAEGEAFDPTPTNIESRAQRKVLPMGLKLAMVPRKTRAETVAGVLTLRLGNEKALENRRADGIVAANMLMRGTKRHSRQQLKEELEKLGAVLGVSGGPTDVSVTFEVRRPNLGRVLELAHEVLREPAFDAKELDEYRAHGLVMLQGQKDDPASLAGIELQRTIDPWPASHPYYNATIDERMAQLKQVKVEGLRDFHQRFYGPQAAELAMVGDFDPVEVEQKLTALFGGWKASVPFERIPRRYTALAGKTLTIETPDRANAAFMGALTLPLRDDHLDAPALVLADFMLGGGFLNSRLATRLRQKEGLSYGAWSRLGLSPLDESSTWGVGAIAAPENGTRVEAGIREELARALKDGFADAEVERAQKGFLQLREQSRARDMELARKLAEYLFVGRNLTFDQELEKKVGALKPQDVRSALGRHFDASRLTLVKAGDFARAGAKGSAGAVPKTAP